MNIILDVDTGEDDALAILLATNTRLDVALVVSSYGNASIENTTRNTQAVVALAGLAECPVFRGAPGPSRAHPHFTSAAASWESAADFLGSDGLCGIPLPNGSSVRLIESRESERVQRLAELVRQLAPVHYVVTGPCTNLAELCNHCGEEILTLVSKVSVMGGALAVPGNSGPVDPYTGTQAAEFNFYCDPFAVNTVLRSGLPVYVVPWDTTHRLTIPFSRVEKLHARDEKTRFVMDLMKRFFHSYGIRNNRQFEFNDPAALWLSCFAPEQFRECKLHVVEHVDKCGVLCEYSEGYRSFIHVCADALVGSVIETLLEELGLVSRVLPATVRQELVTK